MDNLKTLAVSVGLVAVVGCGGSGWHPKVAASKGKKAEGSIKVQNTVVSFQERSPQLKKYFDESYGVAVFSTVGKGAWVVGGAYGKGEVFEQGRLIGSTSLTQLTVGAALGGQAYSEVIFFENKATFEEFTSGNFELGAQVSVVALNSGASADASYDRGVAVFTLAKGGLMYEAAVSGQKFGYTAL